MAQIIIEVPDAIAAKVVIAISAARGYKKKIVTGDPLVGNEIDNPQTRVAFIKQTIVNSLKSDYKRYQINLSRVDEAKVNAEAETFINELS